MLNVKLCQNNMLCLCKICWSLNICSRLLQSWSVLLWTLFQIFALNYLFTSEKIHFISSLLITISQIFSTRIILSIYQLPKNSSRKEHIFSCDFKECTWYSLKYTWILMYFAFLLLFVCFKKACQIKWI